MESRVTPVKRTPGFTLIEVLVVMLIISIMTSFAVIAIGKSKDRALEEEAKRLTALLRMGSEEAVLRSTDYVLTVAQDGYRFYEWSVKDHNFIPLDAEDGVFRPRQLPKDMLLGGEINGTPIVFPKENKEDKKGAQDSALDDIDVTDKKKKKSPIENKPVIYFFSSGERIPFALEIRQDFGATYKILGGINGKIDYQAPERGV
ncbi:MAG: type II secretion system minor pseudopilin GspH [Pseudomonadota bacterium]